MIAAALALIQAAPSLPPLLPADAPACRHDRAAALALDDRDFDQNPTGGWRALSMRGCEAAAADLLRDYRAAHASPLAFLFFWHEGQLRADIGQTGRAMTLFEHARKTEAEDRGVGWNLYVDGSIAFLRRDRAGLQAARDRLAALPMPPGLADARGPDGKPRRIAWPMNLNVLDGLLRCYERPYRLAYAAPCSVPATRITVPPL